MMTLSLIYNTNHVYVHNGVVCSWICSVGNQVYGESLVQGFHRGEIQHTPVKSPRSKCILSATGTIESINLDSVPQSVPRLDNTAAKHKLSVKPKNQRVSRKHRKFTPVS